MESIVSEEDTNSCLSIVLPTYNRAIYLDHSLGIHLPILEKYAIKLYIFDNASTDNTCEVVEKWRHDYPLIEYHRNDKNYGPDDNFQKALSCPGTKYIWLLGDTYCIPEEGIVYLLEAIEGGGEYSVIVFNLANIIQMNGVKTKDYRDHNAVLADLGALMTCLSCLVYNREFLKTANFSRYKNSNFIQTGIIFEALPGCENVVHWVQAISVEAIQFGSLKKNGWYHTHNVFEIACRRWANFVFSLPVAYSMDAKFKCLLDFGRVSGIFTPRNLLNLRRLNILNFNTYRKYSRYFSFSIALPKIIIILLCLTPQVVLKLMLAIAVVLFEKDRYEKCARIFRDEV
jgi:glycosyltransferase involved in cell wall biosynthesis